MEIRVRILSTLIPFIILQCVFTFNIIENVQTVSIHPKGRILVRYGDDLTIFCTVNGEGTSANLAFTIGEKLTPFEVFNDTTIKIFIKKPEPHASYGYRCRNNKTRIGHGETVFVTVAAPPTNVTDFKCISYNLDVLKCSWTTPEKIIKADYNLTMLVVDKGSIFNCEQFHEVRNTTPTKYYCIWDTSKEPRYMPLEKQLSFTLKSHNIIDTITQKFHLDHYTVVKPNKPVNLTVVSERPHNVLLQWNIPNSIFVLLQYAFDELEHKIEYHIEKFDNSSDFRPVDTSILPKKVNYEMYKINLTDLPYAHMKYKVRISIKLKRAESDEYWSDFNELDFCTASERPRRPPEMIAGGFHHNKFGENRMVYVYWKQLEEYEEAGANFTYKVVITMQGSRNFTCRPEKDKSLGYLYLSNATLEAMQISIWSYNEIGQSVDSSHMYIPPERETRSLRLTSFTKLAYENGTYELSWVGIPNIDNYTLFWCHHKTTNICNGRINFKEISPNNDRHVINLPRDYRYQFAISANNGTKSSGMIWPKCDVSIDGVAMNGFGIQFTEQTIGKNFVTLRWSMECTLRYGFLIGYNITYHPVLYKSTTCNDTIGSTKPIIINNTKQKNINIPGLRSYTTYQFNMSLITIYGLKTIEKATFLIKTLEDTPTTPRNVKISNVQSEYLIMSWDPPLYLNGHFGNISYEIFNYENEKNKNIIKEVKYKDIIWTKDSRIEVILERLKSFTNYSLSVRACNEVIATCSNRTSDTSVRTRIGKPSKLTVTSNNTIIKWEPPKFPGGKVNFYEIKITTDDNSIIESTTNLEYPLQACEDAEKQMTYQVRAVNLDNLAYHGVLGYQKNVELPQRDKNDEITFPGDWSDKNKVMCIYKQKDHLAYILLTLGVMIGVVSWGIKWYKDRDLIRKSIDPLYPPNLLNPQKYKLAFETMHSEQDQEDLCTASNPSHDDKDKTKHYFKVARSNIVDLAGGSNNTDISSNHSSNTGVGKEMSKSQNCTETVLKVGLTVNQEEPIDMLTDLKENAIKHHPDAKTNQHLTEPHQQITNGYVNPDDVKNGLRHVQNQTTNNLTQVDIPRALAIKDNESPSNKNKQSYIPVSAVSRPISCIPSKPLTTANGYTVLEDTKHPNNDSPRLEEVKEFVNLSKDNIPGISASPSNSKGHSYVQIGDLSNAKSTKPNKPLTTANGYTVLEDTKHPSNDSTRSAKVEELVNLFKDDVAEDFLLESNRSPYSKEQSYFKLGVMSSSNSPIPKTANGYTILKDTNEKLAHSSGPMYDDLINQSAVELPSTNQHFKSKQEFNSQPTRTKEAKKIDGKSFKPSSAAAVQLTKDGYILRPEVMVKPQPYCHNNPSQHSMEAAEIVPKKSTEKKTIDGLPQVEYSVSQTSYSKEPIEKNPVAVSNDVPTKSVKPSTNGYVTPEEAKKKGLAKISSMK